MKRFCVHITLCLFQVVACCVVLSCKPPAATTKEVSTTTKKDSIREKIVEKLVPYAVPGEKVTVTEYIECDSVTNKPKPSKGSAHKGRSETSFNLDKNGKLTTDCKCDSLELMLKERDREITIYKETEKNQSRSETKPVYVTRKFDWICRFMAFILIVQIFLKLKKFFPV